MVDSDNPRGSTSGSRQLDAEASADRPVPDASTAAPDIPQRHHLPMRKAGTLPDVSRYDDGDDHHEGAAEESQTASSAGSHPVSEVGAPEAGMGETPTAGRSHDDGHAREGSASADHSSDGVMSGTLGDTSHDMPQVSLPGAADDRFAGASADDRPDSSKPGAEPSTDTAALSVRPPDHEAARRAAARDHAATAKPALARFLQVMVALFFPVIVVAAAVRAVATASFLWFEYHRPGFPADRFGFTLDDRMTYGSYALDYVVNFAPARYLGDLRAPEGEPLFLASEVGHMADVKGVLGLSFFIALVLFVLAVLACVYLARRYKGGIRRALFAGAVLTLAGIVTLTVLAVIAWETFFTQVHALFFADGTWTFRVDDTLIRLFPEQFWTDSAVTIAVLVLGATLLTLITTWPTKARRERSMLAQEAMQQRTREALAAS